MRFRRLTAATAAFLLTAGGATMSATSASAATPEFPALPALPALPSIPADAFGGTWTAPFPGEGYLTFHPDGSVTGSDGCNAILSRYQVHGISAQIDPFASTLMACIGSSNTWLTSTTSVDFLGPVLVVHGQQGLVTGVLVRG